MRHARYGFRFFRIEDSMPVFRSWLYWIIGGLVIVAGSFTATLWVANYVSPLCPQGPIVKMSPPFAKFLPTGVAYVCGGGFARRDF
jgi:hypothetical protein